MSEMDWETSGQPFPTHQSPEQSRCPYRPSAERENNFQFPNSQPPVLNPNVAFNPTQGPPQGFWDDITHQNLPPQGGMSNRFSPTASSPPGRAPEFSNFDYQTGLDGQPQPSGPTRPSRFEASRPLVQRRSYLGGSQPGVGSGSNLTPSSAQPTPTAIADMTSRYNNAMSRRNGSVGANPHDNSNANAVPSQNRHLPPPNAVYQNMFVPSNVPYHRQARFPTDPSNANNSHGSVPLMPPHPPHLREGSWTRPESGQPNPSQRNLFYEAFYSTHMADVDSDDDSIEAQEENLRRQQRVDPGSALQLLQESMRLSPASRRANSVFDPEAHELAMERARAARRAAAAAVKFVASASALASLEKLELIGLTGDDKNCIICYNEFGVKNPDGFVEYPVRLPKCKHVFGDRCLKQWLQDSDSCPYCRDKLPSEPKRNPPGEDIRRITAQSRPYSMDPWVAAEASRIQGDSTAAERGEHYQQYIHQRYMRREEGPEDILARIRRRGDDYEWGTSFNQTSMGLPSRSMPDYDGRRRARGHRSVSRTASQTANRSNAPSSTRATRNTNLQSGPLRTPTHSSTPSFDENVTSQRRSVTPHPTITGTAWSSPTQAQAATSGRPSSLPSERSPLGDPTTVRNDSIGPRIPSDSNTIASPLLDRLWSENNNAPGSMFHGWMMPTTSNGRPLSATFINETPQARLQQLQDDLNSLNGHIQNRLPPYVPNSNDAGFAPQTGSYTRR